MLDVIRNPAQRAGRSSVVIRSGGRAMTGCDVEPALARFRNASPATRRRRDREASEVSYRWVEHTAEVQMEIEAGTEAAVFTDALRALGELLADDARGEQVRREVTVGGHERAAMLVGWLEELVFLAETEDLVPEDTERIEVSDHGLVATLRCHRGRPRHLVKGATYHGLVFERSPRGFRATVVLDV
jgi:SHS2 domain-containing protein